MTVQNKRDRTHEVAQDLHLGQGGTNIHGPGPDLVLGHGPTTDLDLAPGLAQNHLDRAPDPDPEVAPDPVPDQEGNGLQRKEVTKSQPRMATRKMNS